MSIINCFHASSHCFQKPTYDRCVENRSNHENGNLGLWFSTNSSWIKGFGSNIYQFNLNDNADMRTLEISIGEISSWNKQRFNVIDYKNKRIELMERGHDFIKIIENNGSFDMGIVLNFDAIVDFSLVSKKRVENLSSRHIKVDDFAPG